MNPNQMEEDRLREKHRWVGTFLRVQEDGTITILGIKVRKGKEKKDEIKGGIHMPGDYDVDHAIDEQLSKEGTGRSHHQQSDGD